VNRQAITWIVIFAVLALIVIVRSFFGHGMGRVYVKEVSHAYVQADVPALGSPIVEDDSAISGLEPDDAAQGSGQDEIQWIPADSEEAADFATPEQRKNVAAWKVYKRVPPKEQFEVEMNNEELGKVLDGTVSPPLDARPDLESALNSWKTAVSPEVQIDWFSLSKVDLERSKPVDMTINSGTWREAAMSILAAAGAKEGVGEIAVVNGEIWVTTTVRAPNPVITLSWAKTIGLWVAVFFTLAIFSFLYRDNFFYKIAESSVVGVSAAYWMVIGFWDMIIPNLVGRLAPMFVKDHFVPGMEDASPDWLYLIPAIFGVFMLMRLSPKGGWLSLWTLAFIIGITAALRMVHYIESDFLSQLSATIIPLWSPVESGGSTNVYSSIWASIRNITIVIGVLTCLTYFFFSVEHKGVVGRVARVGIWFLMITFGAAFGFTVMGRIALLAARFEFLFDDWMWLIDPTNQRTVAAAASVLGF
jgi:hypothetical protein